MMGILGKIIGDTAGGLIGGVGKIIDEFHTSGEEKQEFELKKREALLKVEALLQKRDSEIEQTIRTELEAKERVIVAEMAQGDNYTKRARPSIVYVGLGMMILNFSVLPLLTSVTNFLGPLMQDDWQPMAVAIKNFPEEFWWAWSGVVGTWSIGRSLERRGVSSNLGRKAVAQVTGSQPKKILDL